MIYNPEVHQRRSLRLKDYDYTQAGAYFVTICVHERVCRFGDVVDGVMVLSDAGAMLERVWAEIPAHYSGIAIDAFVVMPNHIHGIVHLTHAPPVGAGLVPALDRAPTRGAPTSLGGVAGDRPPTRVAPALGDVIGAFKSRVTLEYIRGVKNHGWPPFSGVLWQRNYYEHIIRDDLSLGRIREYIRNNPQQWAMDRENPLNLRVQGEP